MASPSEKLAASLALLEALQEGGTTCLPLPGIDSSASRASGQERLSLREVMKGWLISSSPDVAIGDTTPWFASFWEFCAAYCRARFGEEWHLSPEQSLLLHAENTVIPPQLIVYTPKGTNNTIGLPFGTSLYDLRQRDDAPAGRPDRTRRAEADLA